MYICINFFLLELGFDLNTEADEVYPHFARLLQVSFIPTQTHAYIYIDSIIYGCKIFIMFELGFDLNLEAREV